MPQLQLGFHGKFALKKSDLLKLLSVANTEIGLNDSLTNLVNKTKFGSKKVTALKSWAIRSGLINDDNFITPECKIILEKDPYLKSSITDWFIHFNLSFSSYSPLEIITDIPVKLGGWSYFIYDFLPNYKEFTLDDLVKKSAEIFNQDSVNTIKNNFRFVIRAYLDQEGMAQCKFLQKINNNTYLVNFPDISPPFMPYIIGYVLAILWQRDFKQQSSILLTDLINQKMGFMSIFAINENNIFKVLNSLENNQIVQQRSAQPYLIGKEPKLDNQNQNIQIIKCWSNPLDLLTKAYENDYSLPNQPLINVLAPFLLDDDIEFSFLKCEIFTPKFNCLYFAS